MGLKSCRQQRHNFETIAGPIADLRKRYPVAGILRLRDMLRTEKNMLVSKCVNSFV
jgi:hypothetical protein